MFGTESPASQEDTPNILDHVTNAIQGMFQWTGASGESAAPLNSEQEELLHQMTASFDEPVEKVERDAPGSAWVGSVEQKLMDDKCFAVNQLLGNSQVDLQMEQAKLKEMMSDFKKTRAGARAANIAAVCEDKMHELEFEFKRLDRELHMANAAHEKYKKGDMAAPAPKAILFSGRAVSGQLSGGDDFQRSPSSESSGLKRIGRRNSAVDIPSHLLRRPSIENVAVPKAVFGRRPSFEAGLLPSAYNLQRRRSSEENITAIPSRDTPPPLGRRQSSENGIQRTPSWGEIQRAPSSGAVGRTPSGGNQMRRMSTEGAIVVSAPKRLPSES